MTAVLEQVESRGTARIPATDIAAHILIVEGSAEEAERLRQLLSANDYAVTIASNGKEGLAAARERKPALIISDITMPVMDGFKMCRAIKDDDALCDTPVVLLTELSEPTDLVRGIQAGTDFYLTKPYEPQDLLARIESVLATPNGSGRDGGEDGLEISVDGQSYVVNAGRKQILNLLLSTYENAVLKNGRLVETRFQLEELNNELENRVQHRTRQLEDSEYRYRALFEQAADSIVLVDPQSGALVEFNDRAHENLGYTRDEFAELKIPDIEMLEAPEEVTEHIERILREGSDLFETKHRTKSGEVRDILVRSSATLLRGRDFVQSIWTDITERKQAERRLAATNAQLEDALAWARENAEIANALSEAASVLNSTLNLEEVLDRILAAVGRVAPHDAANIMLLSKVSGNELEAKIVRDRGKSRRGQRQSLLDLRLRLADVPNLQEIADTGMPRAISDTQASDQWVPISETAWIRSWAGAPLQVEGETIGFLNISSETAGFFTQESADRLQVFADHAALAIQNARLYSQAEVEIVERIAAEAEIRERSEDLALLNSIGEAINRHDSLPKIIDFVADQTTQVFSGYGTTVSLLSEGKTQLHLQNLALPPAIIGQIAKLTDSGPSGISFMTDGVRLHREVVQKRKSMVVDSRAALKAHIVEIAKAARLPSEKGRKVFVKLIPKLFGTLNIESMMLAPLISEDEVIGVLELASKRRLMAEDLTRFEGIAAQLTVAIKRVQAEEALRESEEKFRTLSEKSPNMIFINQSGKVVYANEACVDTMGYSLDEFYAPDFDFMSLISPDSRELVKANFSLHMQGREVPPAEYRLTARDGTQLDTIHTTRLIQYGGRSAILGILTDVTKRKQAEEEIQQRTEDLSLINSVNDAINRGESLSAIITLLCEELRSVFSSGDAIVHLLSDDGRYLTMRLESLPPSRVERIEGILRTSIPTVAVTMDSADLYPAILAARKPVLIEDAEVVARLMREHTASKIFSQAIPMIVQALKIKSSILIPLISEERAIGVLSVSYKGAPGESDIQRLESIASQLTLAIERQRAQEKVRQLNEELEHRVLDRTQELQAANKELESFSYSVSHDLRAPLRAMDGFSRILMEDYSSELPEQGRGYLQRVRDNAKHMGQLVDDLLAFSRLGRAEMRKQPFAPDELAHEVLNELTADRQNGHVEVSIVNMPECYGDVALLKQVYVNLLSNALKFTRNQTEAKIEVGYRQVDGEAIYYVKDNGAGFDMAYADKLFGVFQRLHGPDEFEGTGVGLAIVQRVIQRHRGRVWAEAEVDQGATFFFTLGANSDLD